MLRWGVLGGSARIYRHHLAPVFAELPGHLVVGEASRDQLSEAPYAELIARPDVDAVYIPLPNHLHLPWIERSLEAGKHVLCEKPIGLTAAETERAFAAARAADRHLVEAYMWPHHPRSQQTLDLVAAGAIGAPRFLHGSFTYRLPPGDHRTDERGGGVILDVGIYCIAPAMLIAGREPRSVHAAAVRNDSGVDTAMSGFVDWGDGFVSSFEVCLEAAPRRTLEIIGTDGIMTFPKYQHAGSDEPTTIVIGRGDGGVETIAVDDSNGYRGMVEHFARVVRGEAEPLFGEEHSLRLARILDEAHRVSRRHGDGAS